MSASERESDVSSSSQLHAKTMSASEGENNVSGNIQSHAKTMSDSDGESNVPEVAEGGESIQAQTTINSNLSRQ